MSVLKRSLAAAEAAVPPIKRFRRRRRLPDDPHNNDGALSHGYDPEHWHDLGEWPDTVYVDRRHHIMRISDQMGNTAIVFDVYYDADRAPVAIPIAQEFDDARHAAAYDDHLALAHLALQMQRHGRIRTPERDASEKMMAFTRVQ